MKNICLFLGVLVFGSCDLIKFKKEITHEEKPIATVYNKHLYKKNIKNFLPKNVVKEDSLVIVKGLINSWAKQQLFLTKAEENISEVNSIEIERLVNDYRASLYINEYKEKIIKQKLDTIVPNEEIATYFEQNKENFKLKNDLLQFDYVNFAKNHLERDEIVVKFKSNKGEVQEKLDKYLLSMKSYRLGDTTWVTTNYLKDKIPLLRNDSKEKLLKISKFIQKEDSLGVYLVSVKNVLRKNQIAPLSYVRSRIKQVILHKRKIELIREIEKTLINDAIKNKNFKEY